MTSPLPPTVAPLLGRRRAGRRRPPASRGVSGLLEHTLLGPALVAGAAAGVLGALQVVDPGVPGHYPTCPFLATTGWFCPGCGSLRMLHALGDGDLVGAAAMNSFALVMLPVLALYWLQWVRRVVTGAPRGAPAPGWVVWGFLVVSTGFAVARNLPGLELLAPG